MLLLNRLLNYDSFLVIIKSHGLIFIIKVLLIN
jgi:hypothetical protein